MSIVKFHQNIKCTSAHVMDDIMEAIEKTGEIASKYKIHKNDIIYLQLVTEEACYNAFEYCQKTKKDEMTIKWSIDNGQLVMSIKHEGEPFEIKKQEEMNYGRRGRGLQLILHFMDHVSVESCNKHVELVMKKNICDQSQKRTG